MKPTLTPYEARVIGALIEKQITTPDQYPLSLNALTNACNQKSNRNPVLDLDENTVQQTLDGLAKRYLVGKASGFSNRVTKYQHRFCNAEYGELKLTDQEVAVVCELLLRGPQTPGELRAHAERLCPFSDVQQVEETLSKLLERDEPFVAKLPREPGRRESRYMHLFSGEAPESPMAESGPAEIASIPDRERLDRLERHVAHLTDELDRLKEALSELTPGPKG